LPGIDSRTEIKAKESTAGLLRDVTFGGKIASDDVLI